MGKLNLINDIKLYFLLRELRKEGEPKMRNWKTTVSGLVAVVGFVLPTFGVPHEVASAVQTVGVFLVGLFAKDHSVTGTGM